MQTEKKSEGKKREKKVFIRVLNPMRANKYNVDYRRGMTVRVDASIAEKAISNNDAEKV